MAVPAARKSPSSTSPNVTLLVKETTAPRMHSAIQTRSSDLSNFLHASTAK